MLDHKSSTPQHSLQPIGPIKRSSPRLQKEIGASPADLLLQIDHWITFEGKQGWITMSAHDIQQRAFPTWSTTKIRRLIHTMTLKGYLILASQVWPTKSQTPMIALNHDILAELVSVQLADPGKTPRTQAKRLAPRQNASDTQAKRLGPTSIYYKSQKQDPNGFKEGGEGKAPQPSNPFILALSEICVLNSQLNANNLQDTAQLLNNAGYTDPFDLYDLKHWWDKHDYRKGTPPTLKQVAQVIHQALTHKDTIRRRHYRAEGLDWSG